MDIDEIFKRPPLPKGSTKRKFEAPTPPDPSSYNTVGASTTTSKVQKVENGNGKGKGVTIEEYKDGDEDEDDDERDESEFAPGGDADYYEEEDEDGARFFGSGLSSVQKQVLNIMESGDQTTAPPTAADDLTPSGVRKQLLNLEKAINKNRDLRTKFGHDPEKFVDSEFNLLQSLSSLLLLSSIPLISYPLLLELSTLVSLSDLLSHENTDVSIAVIELLEELTDEEVLEGDGDNEEEEGGEDGGKGEREREREKRKECMRGFVQGVEEAGLVELIVGDLERLNEDEESERNGVYHTLGLLENLLLLHPPFLPLLLSSTSPFLPFLLHRILPPTKDKLGKDEFDQNRFYAGEMLSVVLGMRGEDGKEGSELAVKGVEKGEGVEALLRVLSTYRRKSPTSSDELEFLENIYTSLSLLLPYTSIKSSFLLSEGPELLLLIMKEKGIGRIRAIKVLDYALLGCAGGGERGEKSREIAGKVVEEGGLKFVFAEFMGKTNKKKKSTDVTLTHSDTEHILSLLSSLFISLPSSSPHRIRLLTKFVENDYEKIDRLIELREEIEGRIAVVDPDEEEEGEEDEEGEEYLRRLEKGLFSLQLTDYLIAWGCMEDDGIRDHAKMLLSRKDQSFKNVIEVLKEYRDNIGEGEVPGGEEGETEVEESVGEAVEQRGILEELIKYLERC